ncbi:MAG: polyprenyl synthetase family protein [Phycisphaerales bacterium]|nr:polyprenyl synthetase family protein [Phycisphaerales bacterium]
MDVIKDLQKRLDKIVLPRQWDTKKHHLYDPINYVLGIKGKRLRPVLCLLSHQFYSPLNKKALDAALAIEWFHNFTLMHDDIMDQATLRRGYPSVNVQYGTNQTLLSGDALLIECYQLLGQRAGEELPEILALFNKMALDVCIGQQLDMEFENKMLVSMPDYLEMIKLKTGVLIGASLQIGARLGGGNPIVAKKLYELGVDVGVAFQIEDDFLDCFGSAGVFGKKIGGDIQQNKKNFLWILALQIAPKDIKNELLSWYQKPSSAKKINKILAIYQHLNLPSLAEKQIHDYSQKALKKIMSLSLTQEQKIPLIHLVEQLIRRKK